MTDLLVWGGPVQASNLNGIVWADGVGPQVVVFNQGPDGGIGSSSFALLAQSMTGSDGHILPNLLASKGLDRSQFGKVMLAGFSAFHGLASAVANADADMVDAMILIDSCFSAVDPSSWPKQGYVDFGARAAKGQKLMVYTASAGGGPGGQYPSSTGSQCMLANLQGAASEAGVSLSTISPPDPMPAGDGYQAGSLYGFDYGSQYNQGFTHSDLINRWGVDTMQAFAVPFFSGALTPGTSGWKKALYVAGAAVLVVGAAVGGVLLARRSA